MHGVGNIKIWMHVCVLNQILVVQFNLVTKLYKLYSFVTIHADNVDSVYLTLW
jgi:hypothetical protein